MPKLLQEYCIIFSQKNLKVQTKRKQVLLCITVYDGAGVFYLHYILLCLTCTRRLRLLQHSQEVQEGVIRAQLHNRQLLQQFEEAQGTLRKMLTLTAAMKTTRVRTVTDTCRTESECSVRKKKTDILNEL